MRRFTRREYLKGKETGSKEMMFTMTAKEIEQAQVLKSYFIILFQYIEIYFREIFCIDAV